MGPRHLQRLPHAACTHAQHVVQKPAAPATFGASWQSLQSIRRARGAHVRVLTCRQVKERQVEDHLFGDKEKFVTAAYKKELQERQLWEARQKVK
jgi:hypothetical protein